MNKEECELLMPLGVSSSHQENGSKPNRNE